MPDPPLELAEPIYIGGLRRRIFAYRTPDGRSQVLEFLEALSSDARARYLLRFRQMGDEGALPGKFWHPWDGKRNRNAEGLSCFKDNQSQTRIPSFSDDSERGVMILTHGFGGKKEDGIENSEINEAARIKRDYSARRAACANDGKLRGTPRQSGKKAKRK